MRDKNRRTAEELMRILDSGTLSEGHRAVVRMAMDFGYSAAYCSRTCDRAESYFQADQFDEGYEALKKAFE